MAEVGGFVDFLVLVNVQGCFFKIHVHVYTLINTEQKEMSKTVF